MKQQQRWASCLLTSQNLRLPQQQHQQLLLQVLPSHLLLGACLQLQERAELLLLAWRLLLGQPLLALLRQTRCRRKLPSRCCPE